MTTTRKLQVFVSSTYLDLVKERQSAVTSILENGHIPAGMELFAAGSEEQLRVIRRWIDESDIFVLILGKRYGSIEPTTGLSYIQLEYEYAVAQNKPFFAIVLNDSFVDGKVRAGMSLEDVVERAEPDKYRAFKAAVTSRLCKFVDDEKDIKLAVAQSIHNLEKGHEFVGWVSGRPAVPQAPVSRLPPYIGRDLGRILEGDWAGTAREIDVIGATPPVEYEVSWTFHVSGSEIAAVSTARGPNGIDAYTLRGHFLHDRFVRLEYFNDDMGEVNFGTEVLQLSDNGRRLEGRFVGYSSARSAIISGVIEGTKLSTGKSLP